MVSLIRYAIADNYWLMVNRVYPRLSESDDNGYHFGCSEGNIDVNDALTYLSQLCSVVDVLVRGTRDCIDALDYPWIRCRAIDPSRASPRR